MPLFELVVALLLGAVLLAAFARRIGAPYPTFLALGGILLALVPGMPVLTLDPGLVLALFVAPVLLDAAFDSSPRDLRDNWVAVGALAVVAVGLTTAAVAWLARALVPDLPWAAAVALGAIVAPPDAAAATAVLRQVRIPHRLLTILEGESLLNDAAALLIYRLAVGAVAAGGFAPATVAPAFLLGVAGSLVAGPALAWLYLRLTDRFRDGPSTIVLQFVATFGVWLIAEHAGMSGVLTIVTYAVTLARVAPRRMAARLRIQTYAVWETAVFVLNVLAFVLIGLQIRPILAELEPHERSAYTMVALAVLAAVIAVRFAWVMSLNAVVRWRIRRTGFHPRRPLMQPTVAGGVLLSWCGMRGIVTLAAAFALPDAFPYRDLILLTAFCVTVGTLLIQGLTLRPLLAALDLQDDDPVTREVMLARTAAFRAALMEIDGDDSPVARMLRHELAVTLEQAAAHPDGVVSGNLPGDALRRRAIAAARRQLLSLRGDGTIGDEAFHRIEEGLDLAEVNAEARGPA